ncbi:MAG TPA: hypothetical protein VK907_10370, partial [Phnomibacter sp.]|nr:hypothetical protein [Phnomibacter sp.]
MKHNVRHLEQELQWLGTLLVKRAGEGKPGKGTEFRLTSAPVLRSPASVYQHFIKSFELDDAERAILILALQPHIAPGFLEAKLIEAGVDPARLAELGCVKTTHYSGMLPTGETALFLLAGRQMEQRIMYTLYFTPAHKFYSKNILRLSDAPSEEPETSGILTISKEILYMLTSGTQWRPHFNTQFPARQVTTSYTWEDLVLNDETLLQMDEIRDWLAYRLKLLNDWGFSKHTTGGYKCLFYGPPGTGKSLA